MVGAWELDEGLSFGSSIGCLAFLGDFWFVCLGDRFWLELGRFWC
jgi:hypothetical protein